MVHAFSLFHVSEQSVPGSVLCPGMPHLTPPLPPRLGDIRETLATERTSITLPDFSAALDARCGEAGVEGYLTTTAPLGIYDAVKAGTARDVLPACFRVIVNRRIGAS